MKIVFISDFTLAELPYGGGAEFNDQQLTISLQDRGLEVEYFKSLNFTEKAWEKNRNNLMVISNFLHLSEKVKSLIQKNSKYIIYEHDHKYLKNRNPLFFKNFEAPKTQIRNYDFYKESKYVFCQSSFHKKIVDRNLKTNNTFNVSGNLWKKDDLVFIKNLSETVEKKDICSIMDSPLWNKNMKGAIEYCSKNNIAHELIADKNYHNFLKKMCFGKKFIFLPKSPETLSRVCVEAKMLGCGVYTNNLVGAKHEDWFKAPGNDIISYMMNIDKKIVNKITEVI